MSDSIDEAVTETQETPAAEVAKPDVPPEAAEQVPEPGPDDAPSQPEPEEAEPDDAASDEPTPSAARQTTVLILGTGASCRELALAFERLGVAVVAADRGDDADELTALIDRERPHYVVTESGAVAADALIAVAEQGDTEVLPTPRGIRLS